MTNPNKSFEPMDVDLSGRSSSAMDISDNNYSATEIRTEELVEDCHIISSPAPAPEKSPELCPIPKTETKSLKKFHINIKSQSKKTGISHLKIFTCLIVVVISIVIYHCRIQCYKELNLKHLKETLSNQVFGQAKAIESIIGALESDKQYKVLFFYGGTGVGKTYTSSLILDNLGLSSNVYHYTMPTFLDTFPSNLKLGLIICDSSVIIIDDLSEDMNVSEQINDVIAKSKNLQKKLTIIIIYNCAGTESMFHKKCDESFNSILLKNYYNADISFSFIKFKSLTDASLKNCIDRELGGVKIDKVTYEKILKNFNVTTDGCKGVHTKVKLMSMV